MGDQISEASEMDSLPVRRCADGKQRFSSEREEEDREKEKESCIDVLCEYQVRRRGGRMQKRSERIKGYASARLRLNYLPTRIKAKENLFPVLQFWLNYYEVLMDLILLKFII